MLIYKLNSAKDSYSIEFKNFSHNAQETYKFKIKIMFENEQNFTTNTKFEFKIKNSLQVLKMFCKFNSH